MADETGQMRDATNWKTTSFTPHGVREHRSSLLPFFSEHNEVTNLTIPHPVQQS
jgi:hypothetical protein